MVDSDPRSTDQPGAGGSGDGAWTDSVASQRRAGADGTRLWLKHRHVDGAKHHPATYWNRHGRIEPHLSIAQRAPLLGKLG